MVKKARNIRLSKKSVCIAVGVGASALVLALQLGDLMGIFSPEPVRESRELAQVRTKVMNLTARLEAASRSQESPLAALTRNILKEPPPPPPPAKEGTAGTSLEEKIRTAKLPSLKGILGTRSPSGVLSHVAVFENGTVSIGEKIEGFEVIFIESGSVVLARFGTRWRINLHQLPFANDLR